MRVLRITIQNYTSFVGQHSFDLDHRGLVFVAGRNLDEPRSTSNGSGKSALFDALEWCLFGEHPRGDDADSVVSEEVGKDCLVMAHLADDDGSPFTVSRYRKLAGKNGVDYYQQDDKGQVQNLNAMDAKQTQARVCERLGLDRQVYRAAVYRAQGETFDFAEATDGERKEMLSRIIPELAEVDALKEAVSGMIAEEEPKRLLLAQRMAHIDGQLQAIGTKDYSALQNQWAAQRDHQAATIAAVISQSEQTLAGAKNQEAQIPTLTAELKQLSEPHAIKSAVQARDAQQEHHRGRQQQLAVASAEVRRLETQLSSLQKLGEGQCPCCGQPLTKQHLAYEADRLAGAFGNAKAVWTDINQSVLASHQKLNQLLSEAHEEEAENRAVFSAYAQHKAQLESKIKVASQAAQQVAQIERDLGRQRAALEQLRGQAFPIEQLRAQDDAQKAALNQEKAAAANQIHDLVRRLSYLEFWSTAFGVTGLKSFVLDSRLQDLTDASNEWVQALTGGACWVKFESQTATKSGKLSDRSNVRVFRQGPAGVTSSRSYRSYSGGEKKRIALGIDYGLSRLVAERAQKSWSLLILDEVFRQHLDSGGREAVFDLLQKLQKERESIFCCDHDHELAAQFENRVTIVKQHGRSSISEDGGKKACESSEPPSPGSESVTPASA
jgi:DNA repair exonuclease SbcCD ATPase subunit